MLTVTVTWRPRRRCIGRVKHWVCNVISWPTHRPPVLPRRITSSRASLTVLFGYHAGVISLQITEAPAALTGHIKVQLPSGPSPLKRHPTYSASARLLLGSALLGPPTCALMYKPAENVRSQRSRVNSALLSSSRHPIKEPTPAEPRSSPSRTHPGHCGCS